MNMNKINILFLGGGKRVSIAETFIKAGISLGYNVEIYAYEVSRFEPIAFVANIIDGKKWHDIGIKKHLVSTIEEHNINIVIPFVDIATVLLSELQNTLPNCFFPISNIQLNQLMFDKNLANEFFIEQGFKVPENTNDIRYPLIAKPLKGSGGKGNFIIKDNLDLEYFETKFNRENYFLQLYIDAVEYSVDLYISQNGHILCLVPRKRLEVINGEAVKSVTDKHNKIIKFSENIVNKSGFKGCITIQFLEDKETEDLFLMEINPRLGSAVLTTISAGANIPEMVLKEYLNMPIENINWHEGVMMTRYFKEYFFYANNY